MLTELLESPRGFFHDQTVFLNVSPKVPPKAQICSALKRNVSPKVPPKAQICSKGTNLLCSQAQYLQEQCSQSFQKHNHSPSSFRITLEAIFFYLLCHHFLLYNPDFIVYSFLQKCLNSSLLFLFLSQH